MSISLPRTLERTYKVTEAEAIHFMGAQAPPALSTPALLGWMEWTARECAGRLLQPDQDTVGVSALLKHLAPTPVGAQVRVVAKLMNVEGRLYSFEIEAFDEVEKIAEATHQRAVVLVARFADRIKSKMKTLGQPGR